MEIQPKHIEYHGRDCGNNDVDIDAGTVLVLMKRRLWNNSRVES